MKCILLVEDESDVLDTLAEMLRRRGFEVLTATNGEEALEQERIGRADLVVSDVRMPKIDGFELCRRAIGLRPGLRFILMSGHMGGIEELGEFGTSNHVSFLHKPFRFEALLAEIEKQF
jgi:DNA-binding NtrC family response regulator